jgi:hypothetical protein
MALFQNQTGLAFPTSLSEKYRPQAIADFVGLEKPKKILAKFAAQPYPSAWLFVGPSGRWQNQHGASVVLADQGRANAYP